MGVFLGTFLGPIVVTLIWNVIVFVMVTWVLVKHHRKNWKMKLTRTKQPQDKSSSAQFTIKLMISIASVMILFGLTWFFGVFTIMGASKIFQYLFVITNGFQGSFFFLFNCVLSTEGREFWRDKLSCGGKFKAKKATTSGYHELSASGMPKTTSTSKTKKTSMLSEI